MWLTRSMAGSASGGLIWDRPGAVVEVPDDLALELLAIPGAGFAEVTAPDVEPEQADEPAPDTEQGDAEPNPPAAKRAPRARKPVAE